MFKKILIILLPILFLGTSAQAMFSRGAVQGFKTHCVAMPHTVVQKRGFVSLIKNFWNYKKKDRELHKNFIKELKEDKRKFKMFKTASKELAQREQLFKSWIPLKPQKIRFDGEKMTIKLNLKYIHKRLPKIERLVQPLNNNRAQYLQKKNEISLKPFRWLKQRLFG